MLNCQGTYRLSRFALMRVDGQSLVLESSLNNKQFIVRGVSVMRILAALSRPVQLKSLLSSVQGSERGVLRSFLTTCEKAKLLIEVRKDGITEEETDPLGYWEFHDLLFHSSTRLGRNRRPIGGTYRLKGLLPPESVFTDCKTAKSLLLPKPDVNRTDMPFTQVLARRRSGYGDKPLTLQGLGTFLYWTCRATRSIKHGNEVLIQKLYPSGGSLHPLRVYLCINACEGCARGLYRYMDREHSLALIRGADSTVDKLLTDAVNSTGGMSNNPPALLVISARFPRTAWKYESIAYRLILMEVGVLLQTMYLTATALDLRGCALGSGDSDRFARAAGTNYYKETSVGEFLLGV